MLSLTPFPSHHDVPLRTSLSATAAEAAGGGSVVGLVPLSRDGRRWHATVISADGARDVRLDTVLLTAEVIRTPAIAQAA